MSTNTPKETPRERRKKKAEESVTKRNTPKVKSVGKSSPANSFVPSSEDASAPQIPTGSAQIERVEDRIGNASAVQQEPVTGIKVPTIRPRTLSDMLSEQRKAAVKEQTDAAKMQKYYALTDAFNALGKMGGAALGGAIGGNVLDSAPIVGEYQPSRGYVSAFEEAKKANERLRVFDNMQYQLAVRDEERSYSQQQKKLDREYQKALVDYKNQIDRANADKDFERSRKLKEDMTKMEQDFKERYLELTNKYEQENLKLKNQYRQSEQAGSRTNVRFQHDLYNTVPIAFDDGTGMKVSKSEYESMERFFKGKTIGGVTISDENIDSFIRENPKMVNDFMTAIGSTSSIGSKQGDVGANKRIGSNSEANPTYNTEYTIPMGSMDAYGKYAATSPRNLVEVEENIEEIKKSIADYKE